MNKSCFIMKVELQKKSLMFNLQVNNRLNNVLIEKNNQILGRKLFLQVLDFILYRTLSLNLLKRLIST